TLETKRFQEKYEDIQTSGAELIGISTDPLDKQCRFAEEHRAAFPMIGDADCAISKAYDVLRPLTSADKRVTYVIDENGAVAAVFHHEIQVTKHVGDVLRWLASRRATSASHAH